jgi:hypothetical protein
MKMEEEKLGRVAGTRREEGEATLPLTFLWTPLDLVLKISSNLNWSMSKKEIYLFPS